MNAHEDISNIDVSIPRSITRDAFNIISPLVEVLDVPGIDDAINSLKVFSYIENNLNYMLPIIIFPLTGCVIDTVHFSRLINNV